MCLMHTKIYIYLFIYKNLNGLSSIYTKTIKDCVGLQSIVTNVVLLIVIQYKLVIDTELKLHTLHTNTYKLNNIYIIIKINIKRDNIIIIKE